MSLKILNNIKLSDYTSWLIGGEAEFLCFPENENELFEALSWAKSNNTPYTIIGGGSNILISDLGIKGLTICLRRFSKISSLIKDNQIYITALSGTSKTELLKLFLKHKLPAALFLAGLPGDVGGGVVMNAGVSENIQPKEFMEHVEWIKVMTKEGDFIKIFKNDLTISYRHTDGWQPHVIVEVGMSYSLEQDPEIMNKVREANKNRLLKQPLDWPSCGSVFKNPEGFKAAQLIDQCGLKGFQIGNAQVSNKHANFIINLGDATALDTWEVILHVQKTVFERFKIQLTTEVVRLGEWSI